MKLKIVVPQQELLIDVPDTATVPTTPVTPPPTPTPTPVPARRLFAPDSFRNKPLPANSKVRTDSAVLVDYLVKSTKPKANGGAAVYFPSINVTEYSAPFFIVTDPAVPKSKVTVQEFNKPVKDFTDLHKQLQLEGFRIPANINGSAGTDGSGLIWDQVEDSILEFWQYRNELGIHKISWGAVLKNVSNHPGFIATLPSGEKHGSRASGIALPVGIIRLEDLQKGKLPYALTIAVPNCMRDTWLAPAQRTDGWDNNPSILKMGTLFRLPASFQIPAVGTGAGQITPLVKMMLEAARDYGVYVCDTTAGNNTGFQCEDIVHQAPATETDKKAWAWKQYAPYFAGRQAWEFLQSPATNAKGMWPWEKMVAVEYPVTI